jgi:hypothetical protein
MSQNCFEVRLELNDLREQNVDLMKELLYLRSIVSVEAVSTYRNLTKN